MRLFPPLRVSKRRGVTSADAHTRVLCRDKTQIKGSENMSRSPLNQMAGMIIGAIAMLAMAGPALTDDNEDGNSSKKDEVVKGTTVIQGPATASNTARRFFSFDSRWVHPKLTRFFLAY